MSCFFITGAYRSGTTLLDKLLGSHPSLRVASQPFPLLFVAIKEEFHRSIGYRGEQLPLANYFDEKQYCPEDVTRFLGEFIVSQQFLAAVYERLQDFSGTGTKLPNWAAVLEQIEAGPLYDIYRKLLPAYFEKEAGCYFGCKEILCEEFIPYFLQKGLRCIHIIRDPRDMMCSLNAKNGHEFIGDLRPTLFNIHNWRKSAAFALQYGASPFLHTLRYEDLVGDPGKELLGLTEFLGISPCPAEDVLSVGNSHWKANSSFQAYEGISTAPVGRYKKTLPKSVSEFIEATCFAEMKHLGYEAPSRDEHEMSRIIGDFKEPYEFKRNNPPPDYSGRPGLKALEVARVQTLVGGRAFDAERFIFPDVGRRLQKTLFRDQVEDIYE